MAKLKHLFQPIKVGRMEVKNRVVMPAMEPGFGVEDGCAMPQHTEFIVERARSEPGMIVTGAAAVHPSGVSGPQLMDSMHLWDEKVYPSLEEMVKAVHEYDVKFGAQLNHGGLNHLPEPTVCPSVIPEMVQSGMPIREVTRDELKEYVEAFGVAAGRCAGVGFDFVEIHGAHSYLINEFLTPYYNRRTDEYGGSFENRIRFLLEVVREVRKKAGDSFPVGVRLPGDDFIGEGGWRIDDLCKLAPILEKEGVAYISVSQAGAAFGTLHVNIAPMYERQGAFTHFAEQVKKHVSIPVATVGRIKSPVMANVLVRDGKADLVAMARAQVADPETVAKARNGEIADIRPCLAECLGCIEGILKYGEATCAVNARLGREYLIKEIEGEKRAMAKKVLVAGAGCAGLEAARRAAFAGHNVTLCESKGWIGGQLRLAATIPKREEIGDIIPWYERQLNKLGVQIRLNTPVDEALLDQISPDVLVIATGSLPEVPLGFIQGLENVKDIELVMVDELLEEERLTGDNILVVGGDQIGLQVADYLAERGKIVYVVEKGAHFAEKMASNDRHYLAARIVDEGVKRYKSVERIEILPTDDVWMVSQRGRERLPEIDTVVLASDRRPNIFLAEVAEKKGIETHIVGDACGVAGEGQGTIMAAIAAGYDAGRQI
ncbi:MAG: FAD-dependent oxidoreductase [Dehalococcoidia bacterium]|nr:FAD-dependent oxidoreductase [Dehalococcoidia bacterium]